MEGASAEEKPPVLTEEDIQRLRRNREAFGQVIREMVEKRKAKGLSPVPRFHYISVPGPLRPGDELLPPEDRPSTSMLDPTNGWGPCREIRRAEG